MDCWKQLLVLCEGDGAGQEQAEGILTRCTAPPPQTHIYTLLKVLRPPGLPGATTGPSSAPDFQAAPLKEKQNKFIFPPCAQQLLWWLKRGRKEGSRTRKWN